MNAASASSQLWDGLDPMSKHLLSQYGAESLHVSYAAPTKVIEGIEFQGPHWKCCYLWEEPATLHVVRLEALSHELHRLPLTLFSFIKTLRKWKEPCAIQRIQFDIPLYLAEAFSHRSPDKVGQRLEGLGLRTGQDANGVTCWIWEAPGSLANHSTKASRGRINEDKPKLGGGKTWKSHKSSLNF